jgi:hypothetical protein
VIIELDPPTDPELEEKLACCQFLWGEMYHECGTDMYTTQSLACGELQFFVSTRIVKKDDGECCVLTTLSTGFDSVTYTKCLEFGLLEGFNLQITSGDDDGEYPCFAAGTIEISSSRGISNPGQFGNIEEGTCPKCRYIRLDPRSEPPDLPVEGAECERRNNWQNAPKVANRVLDITDPELFSNEFCWFLPPCKCIPEKLCLKYTYLSDCEGLVTRRVEMQILDCSYGPVTIETDAGDVTITGSLFPNNICAIEWKVEHYKGMFKEVRGLSRIDLSEDRPPEFIKRCDVTVSPAIEVPDSSQFIGGINDTFEVTEECLCFDPPDNSCALSCFDVRMPFSNNPDCFLTTLTGEIMGCDFGGYSMEFHAENFENPTSFTQDQLPISVFGACQLYHAYDTVSRNFTLPNVDCNTPGSYGPPNFGAVNSTVFKFTLAYPTLPCSVSPLTPPVPNNYVLAYELFSVCGLPVLLVNGEASPSSASCDPFELIFDVPFSSVCDCSCSSFQLKITL